MSTVFAVVCDRLGLKDRTDKMIETVAATIIELAQRGVRDMELLRRMTLQVFDIIE